MDKPEPAMEHVAGDRATVLRREGTIAPTARRLLTGMLAVFLAGNLLTASDPVRAQGYRLAPGDKVRAQIIVLDNQTYVATVDTAGNIRLPYLGTHGAAGRTLDELTRDIALAAAGRQLRVVRDGVSTALVLGEDDIFLDIDSYRPVIVVGLVAAPGRVAFEPGMSVRTAMGAAGGAALLGSSDGADDMASWRMRQAEMQQTEAWLLADLWRIEALLSGADAARPPDDIAATLTGRLTGSDLGMVRRRIENARGELQRARDDTEARIELTGRRIEFLETALAQYQSASEIEEARLQDILQLSNRGLATANALDNAREGALNASSRLLTTQADLAETERELQSLKLAKQGLDEDFAARLLEEQTRAEKNLAETRARLSGLGRELALGSLAATAEGSAGGIRILLHRREDGVETSLEVAPDSPLRPGDVVEVLLAAD